MVVPSPNPAITPLPPVLAPDERRWLHDKYERLASEEAQLAAGRTAYYAAIGTVLITGLLVAVADLSANAEVLTTAVTFLALLGLLISMVWAVLLHRTNDAQKMWREAALQLELVSPPIPGQIIVPVSLRSGAVLPIDLLRPYEAHRERFSPSKQISWMDRVNPDALTEILPMTFLGLWAGTLVVVWVWFLALR
ncbi:MAG: hypothetical protein L3K00_02520 [Thermoplasmata archaeon]|nr:hypothetical protein [Thermoplasmata archaeon]